MWYVKKLAYFWVLPKNVQSQPQTSYSGSSHRIWKKFSKLSFPIWVNENYAIGYHCCHWRQCWNIENSPICVLQVVSKGTQWPCILRRTCRRPLCRCYRLVIMAALWNRAGHYIFALWFLSSSIFFLFLAWSQRSQIGCLSYFHTWCGLSANLECRSEMYCTRLAGNARRKNRQKIAVWAPSHNIVVLWLRN